MNIKNNKCLLVDKAMMQQESPFFIKDISGKYVYINHQAAALADLAPEDFIGHDDVEIFGKKIVIYPVNLGQFTSLFSIIDSN
jgi:PAS domain-containing protein